MVNRTVQPGYSLPEKIEIPQPNKLLVSDGREVLWLQIGTQDVVRITLQFPAGTKYQQKSLQASSTLGLISEGTAKYGAQELAEKLDFYGSHIDYSIDRDYATISAFCLEKYAEQTLELLAEIVLHPTYDEKEFDTYRQKRKSTLSIEKQKVMYVAREQFSAALYGRYDAYGSFADAEDYDKLSVDDLRAFHRNNYLDKGALLFVSGMVDESLVKRVAVKLDSVIRHNAVDLPIVDLCNLPAPEHIFIQKNEAVQSAIRVGRVLFPKDHPDYSEMYVLTTILGGYFGSRLMNNIREDKGYTYGIFASLVTMQESGFLAISTEVGCSVTEATLVEIEREIDILRKVPVDYEELALVVNYLVGEILRMLDGPFSIVDSILDLYQANLPIDFISTHLNRIRSVTPEQLMALAQKYLQSDSLSQVVVGKK